MISQIRTAIAQFIRDEEGVAAIEYALLAGVISVGLIAALGTTEDAITSLFTRLNGLLNGALPASGG